MTTFPPSVTFFPVPDGCLGTSLNLWRLSMTGVTFRPR